MGCRTEPAIVHIAYVLQKLHFFQFFHFFDNLHDFPQNNYTCVQKKIQFFFIICTIYHEKNYTHLPSTKLHDLTIFVHTSYIFHISVLGLDTEAPPERKFQKGRPLPVAKLSEIGEPRWFKVA